MKHLTAMVTDGAEALKYYTAKEAAELTGMPEETVSLFFLLQGFGDRVRADRLLEAAGAFAAGNEALEGLRGNRVPFLRQRFQRVHGRGALGGSGNLRGRFLRDGGVHVHL